MTASESPAHVDPVTGQRFALETPRWRAPHGGPLMLSMLPGIGRADIATGVRSIWRYQAALPLEIARPISLGEGMTPLVDTALPSGTVACKLEWFSPTGSFKDRGASVMLSYLRQAGVETVVEDSSGNGGAAVAAYAAAAGMGSHVFAPADTQPSKLAQIRAFGAAVDLVEGPRDATERAAMRSARDGVLYASHNWQPWFLQGTKLLAYELWEDGGFVAPDNIVIPMGAGSNVLGCDLGFGELLRAGQIDRLPRLYGVQSANCSPIHAAFAAGRDDVQPVDAAPTIAEGTAIRRPVRGRYVLDALRRSQGATVAVSEAAIADAVADLARQGLFTEPTAAMAVAGAESLLASGVISADDQTVVLLTGSGLKASGYMTEHFGS